MPEKEKLFLSTQLENTHIIIKIKYKEESLSDEDLEQFFFPRFTGKVGTSNVDLPLSKVIIYRHRGRIDVSREKGSIVVIRIELPTQ